MHYDEENGYVLRNICPKYKLAEYLSRKATNAIPAKLFFHFYGHESTEMITQPAVKVENCVKHTPSVIFFKTRTTHEDIFKKILEDKMHTDVVLKVEGKSFPCHKAFLAGIILLLNTLTVI